MAHKQIVDTQQRTFEKVIEHIFPNISANVRNSEFKSPLTGSPLEIDVWLPSLNLCFEFQDMHHYATTDYYQASLSKVKQIDNIKSHIVRKQDFTIIEISCWWNGLPESIIGTIQFFRPDLLQNTVASPPIPLNPSLDFFERIKIPNVGELMLASYPPHSSQFSDLFSPSNPWWMGEKYDGILSCWNAANSTLYTRSGNKVQIPHAIEKQMPTTFLNAEIWFGRGGYGKAVRWLRNTNETENWFLCRILAFDDPYVKVHSKPFEERYSGIVSNLSPFHPFVITNFLKAVLGDGGEGLIFRLPKSPFTPGRSLSLVKLKAVRTDYEALVINTDDKSISLLTPEGKVIDVLVENIETEEPKRGDVVTYSHDTFTKIEGYPSSPKIHRIREDVEWADVLRDEAQARASNLNEPSERLLSNSTIVKVRDTHAESAKKMKKRLFFEKFAKTRNLDPLAAPTWYNVSGVEFKSTKGAEYVLGTYNGSYMRAVIDLFPEIKFNPRHFTKVPNNYWQNMANRRDFFKNFAYEQGFDPLNPKNWYYAGIKQMLEKKGASSLFINYYSNYKAALMHLFPDIGLEINNFSNLYDHYWDDVRHQRQFFLEFAAAKRFDPLVAENWYSVRKKDIVAHPKGGSLLAQKRGTFKKVLLTCFPNIGLKITKFSTIPPNYFMNENRRREVLAEFAKSRGFDVNDPEEWYKIPMEEFVQFKQGANAVMKCYSMSLVSALLHLLPDLAWDLSKFFRIPRNYCSVEGNRRKLMEEIARDRGFDPLMPGNWYPVSYDLIASARGGRTVLSYYDNNVTNAILHLFPDIGLDPNKFSVAISQPKKSLSEYYWSNFENRKSFCEQFAKLKGFDPKIIKNWKLVRKKDFIAQGGSTILSYYQGNFLKAMTQLFKER